MRGNEIGDDGILLIVDGLQCNNTLTKLSVGMCGLSVKGTVIYKRIQNNLVTPVLVQLHLVKQD